MKQLVEQEIAKEIIMKAGGRNSNTMASTVTTSAYVRKMAFKYEYNQTARNLLAVLDTSSDYIGMDSLPGKSTAKVSAAGSLSLDGLIEIKNNFSQLRITSLGKEVANALS